MTQPPPFPPAAAASPKPGPNAVTAINCTSCGAGQSVLGGGRVQAVACGYCGAVLDAQDHYKVLAQYRDLIRPASPLAIGMTGVLNGVRWTVIGTLGHREDYNRKSWTWVDHQLFSPTHGYCYLTWENGHFAFTRKVRGPGSGGWITPAQVEAAENQPTTYRDGQRFVYYESGTSQITFVEGSFNWVPAIGDTRPYVSLMGDSHMLTLSVTNAEREAELTTFVPPQDIAAAFGLRTVPSANGLHPLQAFTPWKHGTFVRNVGLGFGVAGVVLWLKLIGMGTVVLDQRNMDARTGLLPQIAAQVGLDAGDPHALPFTISKPGTLVEIRLTSNGSNAWGWYDLELVDPTGETVAEFGRLTEYYKGVEDGESWSEGSNTTTATLRLEQPGPYQLFVEQSEDGTWGGGTAPTRLDVRVTEDTKAASWMLFAALLCAIAGAAIMVRRKLHHMRRWSGSDWSDD